MVFIVTDSWPAFLVALVPHHAVSSCRVEVYLPNLAAEIEKASLVVSHAGAGSIFESLLFRVPLVVVPNPVLMGNDQVELAELMDELKHAVRITVQLCPKPIDLNNPTISYHAIRLLQ